MDGRTCLDENSLPSRLPKTRRMPEAFVARKMTERSLRVIETIGRYRFTTTSAIIQLVGGNEDVTHRHLQQLFHQGLISRIKPRSGPANSEFIYFLENSAALRELVNDKRVQAEHLDLEEIRANRSRYGRQEGAGNGHSPGQQLFIDHELMISSFHAGVEVEIRQSDGRVVMDNWRQGRSTWDRVKIPSTGDVLPHRPDAYFVLSFPSAPSGQQRSHFFYEADRGTTNRTKFKLKLTAYLDFFLTGQYFEKYGARKVRAVLVETTSLARMDQLKGAAAELAATKPLSAALFWFTTSGLIREKGIFAALWNCAADETPRSLID